MIDKIDENKSEIVTEDFEKSIKSAIPKIHIPQEITAIGKVLRTWQSNFEKVFQEIQEMFDPYREFIVEISKKLSVPNSSLIYRLELARNGWLLPMDFFDFNILSDSVSVEDGIETVMIDNKLLEKIQDKIRLRLKYPSLQQQFNDAVACFNEGYYFACVYSLAPIIEGLVENTTNPNSVKLIKSFESQTRELGQKTIEDPRTHMLILMLTYLKDAYAKDIKFDGAEPMIINRNWLAHGKYRDKLINQRDCLQLFCAIAAMTDIVEDINSLQLESAA